MILFVTENPIHLMTENSRWHDFFLLDSFRVDQLYGECECITCEVYALDSVFRLHFSLVIILCAGHSSAASECFENANRLELPSCLVCLPRSVIWSSWFRCMQSQKHFSLRTLLGSVLFITPCQHYFCWNAVGMYVLCFRVICRCGTLWQSTVR